MTRQVLLSIYLLLPFAGVAAISIQGAAPDYIGKQVICYSYQDFFTYEAEEETQSKISSNGKFSLNFDLKETQLILLRIGDIKAHMYVEPGKSYQVVFPSYSDPEGKIFSKEKVVQLDFIDQNPKELNNLIIRFNKAHDDFAGETYVDFIRKTAKPKVETFISKVKFEMKDATHPFFKAYMRYALANLKLASNFSKETLYKEYIKSSPIAYHNDAYCDFISQFYTNYLSTLGLTKNGVSIDAAINTHQSRSKLLSALAGDKLLTEYEIRELVALLMLYENSNNKDYQTAWIRKIITEIGVESVSPDHRKMAKTLMLNITRLEPGTPAPRFQLTDRYGMPVKLGQFKGKYVYLMFWASWSQTSEKELNLMIELKAKYGKDIQFVSVSLDENAKAMNTFLAKHPYNWTFLFHGNSGKTKEDYRIKALPTFSLIDAAGKIAKHPAKSPSEGIEKDFFKIQRMLHPPPRNILESQRKP